MNNNTNYKPRAFGIAPVSPYKSQPVAKKSAVGISVENNPVVMKEIARHVGQLNLTVVTKIDTETIAMLKISGLIAFLCQIEQDGKVLAIGRSNAVVSERNKYFDRVIKSAADYALVDCISKLVRLEALSINSSPQAQGKKEVTLTDAYEAVESRGVEMATDKQKNYLLQLLYQNHSDEGIIESESQKINSYSKKEASDAIKSLVD